MQLAAASDDAIIRVAPTGGRDNVTCGSLSSPCASLQFAVSLAAPNGTVRALPGVHKGAGGEGIELNGTVKVTGQGHAVVDCEGSGRGFMIRSGQPTLQGLTVRNCTAQAGGGVGITQHGSGVLADLIVERCEADFGGGIAVWTSAPPALTPSLKNVTVRNSNGGIGGGVYIQQSSPSFDQCSIIYNNNTGSKAGGGGIFMTQSNPSFTDTKIIGNFKIGIFCFLSNSRIPVSN